MNSSRWSKRGSRGRDSIMCHSLYWFGHQQRRPHCESFLTILVLGCQETLEVVSFVMWIPCIWKTASHIPSLVAVPKTQWHYCLHGMKLELTRRSMARYATDTATGLTPRGFEPSPNQRIPIVRWVCYSFSYYNRYNNIPFKNVSYLQSTWVKMFMYNSCSMKRNRNCNKCALVIAIMNIWIYQ